MADTARTGRWLTGRASLLALAALVAATGIAAFVMGGRPEPAAALPVKAGYAPAVNGHHAAFEADALLFRTLHEIGNNRLDTALGEIDKVIQAYPKFRLAHLIKGDLLLARARPISKMGNTNHVPQERLEELREEARARIARYQHERPKDRVPRYLVQLHPRQRHAYVVDTARSTLYVFENHNGEPRYVTDYYISIGKNGFDKFREGDNKTPLGVYHITGSLTREKLNSTYGKLAEQYGVGALPISYPNEWDRREGRNGYGIWLHGVPFDTYSRPPRSSNGCVALTNEDFTTISNSVQIGLTPVIIANGVEWTSPDAARALRKELAQNLESWRRDWESLDTDQYLKHYATNFSSGKQDLAGWSEHKHKVNAGKSWIRVKVENVGVLLYPGSDNLAVVTFDQDYASSNLLNQARKRQYWIREGGGWRIIYEGSA